MIEILPYLVHGEMVKKISNKLSPQSTHACLLHGAGKEHRGSSFFSVYSVIFVVKSISTTQAL
jgi:hypothetical protein